MAPEQAQGRITPACDLYSLGLIVFKMITGEPAIPLGLGSDGDLPEPVRTYLGNLAGSEAIDLPTVSIRSIIQAHFYSRLGEPPRGIA